MMAVELNKWKVIAYSTLVKAEKYILDESDRKYDYQLVIPEEYKIAVSDYIVNH